MAEETKEEGAPAPAKPKLGIGTVLVLVNTLAVLAALGAFVYTKILFKKPLPSEKIEIEKKKVEAEKPLPPQEKQIVALNQVLVNLAPSLGKSHYATITISLEVRDSQVAEMTKAKQDKLLDKLVSLVGKKEMSEINTIQGKLLLKTELIRNFNEMTVPGGVLDVYFSTFMLQ